MEATTVPVNYTALKKMKSKHMAESPHYARALSRRKNPYL